MEIKFLFKSHRSCEEKKSFFSRFLYEHTIFISEVTKKKKRSEWSRINIKFTQEVLIYLSPMPSFLSFFNFPLCLVPSWSYSRWKYTQWHAYNYLNSSNHFARWKKYFKNRSILQIFWIRNCKRCKGRLILNLELGYWKFLHFGMMALSAPHSSIILALFIYPILHNLEVKPDKQYFFSLGSQDYHYVEGIFGESKEKKNEAGRWEHMGFCWLVKENEALAN